MPSPAHNPEKDRLLALLAVVVILLCLRAPGLGALVVVLCFVVLCVRSPPTSAPTKPTVAARAAREVAVFPSTPNPNAPAPEGAANSTEPDAPETKPAPPTAQLPCTGAELLQKLEDDARAFALRDAVPLQPDARGMERLLDTFQKDFEETNCGHDPYYVVEKSAPPSPPAKDRA